MNSVINVQCLLAAFAAKSLFFYTCPVAYCQNGEQYWGNQTFYMMSLNLIYHKILYDEYYFYIYMELSVNANLQNESLNAVIWNLDWNLYVFRN